MQLWPLFSSQNKNAATSDHFCSHVRLLAAAITLLSLNKSEMMAP